MSHVPYRSLVCVLLFCAAASAQTLPLSVPAGRKLDDTRHGPLRTLDGYFPFAPVASPQQWQQRAEELRRRMLLATGLWPMPEKSPLNAVVHGKVERDGFTVERVFFESVPGHFVTGSLFKPKTLEGKASVVLCPHGHWPNGRFYDNGEAGVRNEIAAGAERFEESGRCPLQARCVQLARMGCVVFHYDMIGYADSVQISHRPGFRTHMNGTEPGAFGFFSPAAELRQLNMMGLQTWNSVRALDFVLSLPEADASRVGVTGASGGGTQSFMLAAVDDRVTLSVPAVMVSTAMQGGCTCENAPHLRIGAGNIDIAAITAPRPQLLIAADDWTKEVATKGFPDLKSLYTMLGHKEDVALASFVHFGHNYNAVSRMAMYNFVNHHFKLDHPTPVIEHDFAPLTQAELTVWNEEHPKPAGEQVGDVYEKRLLGMVSEYQAEQLETLVPRDAERLAEFRRVVGGAWDTLIGRRLETVGSVNHDLTEKQDRGSYLLMSSLVTASDHHEQVPALFLFPKENWNKQVVLWVTETGKAELFGGDGRPTERVMELVNAGYAVAGLDMLGQGEATADGKPWTKARVQPYGGGNEAWMRSAAYTFGYNPSLFAQRVHDVLTMTRFIQTDPRGTERVHLVGLGKIAGPIAAAARAQSGEAIRIAVIDTKGFAFASLNDMEDPMFVPGAIKYGDVDALLALSAPHATAVIGAQPAESVKQAYAAAGAAGDVKALAGPEGLELFLAE